MLTTKKKQTIIKKAQVHATDTGSSDVQVMMLTTRIDDLSKHLKKHKKDNHSRRGLIKMVADRRKHLKFLERKNKPRHDEIVKKIKAE
jgi:small subunit ribosomal protein S15